LAQLKDEKYIAEIRSKINDQHTFPPAYYGNITYKQDHGTTHLSIVVDGDAVSLTSTINTYFGAKYAGKYTGIIYNDQMDDFSTPGQTNVFGFQPSEANFIRPGKRPMSSMSPTIIVDKRTGDPRLVVGASGGSYIISAVAQVAIKAMWMGMDIKQAIDDKRMHHQLSPNVVTIENGFSQVKFLL
jgi:gamma-glutamyltranspeptidase/glutathione hydrolase/leukotriene-C4 hydrolase